MILQKLFSFFRKQIVNGGGRKLDPDNLRHLQEMCCQAGRSADLLVIDFNTSDWCKTYTNNDAVCDLMADNGEPVVPLMCECGMPWEADMDQFGCWSCGADKPVPNASGKPTTEAAKPL